MGIVYGNTTATDVVYNGTALDEVYKDGILVFSKPREQILIDSNSPGYETWKRITWEADGSMVDTRRYDGWTTPKHIPVDLTPYNYLEINCHGAIKGMSQPNSINWASLYVGFRDDVNAHPREWGSPYPHLTICHGNQAHRWSDSDNGTVSKWESTGGEFYNPAGYYESNPKTIILDISAATGTTNFTCWARHDHPDWGNGSWYVDIFSARLYR